MRVESWARPVILCYWRLLSVRVLLSHTLGLDSGPDFRWQYSQPNFQIGAKMAEFFRFRSIDSLLGEYQELEEKIIYFASPEELNDPMEGLRNIGLQNIVWDGDKIVWTNLFKHYVFCLNRSCLLLNITLKSRRLDVADIPILERWDEILIPIEKSLFDDVWDRFCNLPYIQEIIEALANTGHKIRYREIVSYIQMMQNLVLLDEIRKTYISYGTIRELPILQPRLDTAVAMKKVLNFIKNIEAVENEQQLDDLLQVKEEFHDDLKFTMEYNTRTLPPEMVQDMNRMLMYEFPRVYVEQLHRLLWPDWYTACFTESFHNSSVWAKYADGHKGVCLIFEALENEGSSTLGLNQKTTNLTGEASNNFITLPFRKVNYADSPDEIDFFRTICTITVLGLRELWNTDEGGNLSEIEPNGCEDVRDNFFNDVTFKTKHWAYEQEYRLILENNSGKLNEKDHRKLTYDFNSLKGIIFGIRTSTEDKIKIIEIIERKKNCEGNNGNDFTFYQANYSAKDGDIHKREIWLG